MREMFLLRDVLRAVPRGPARRVLAVVERERELHQVPEPLRLPRRLIREPCRRVRRRIHRRRLRKLYDRIQEGWKVQV